MEKTDEPFSASGGGETQAHEPWLDRWRERLGSPPQRALDLGCGPGDDTRTLAGWGHSVTAIDISESAIASSAKRTPAATHLALDLRVLPGPLTPGFGIIIASLSLHYFDEVDTRRIFAAIRGLLGPRAVFAFRVNAEDDLNYGATGSHDSWGLTQHGGRQKQFFTQAKIRNLLDEWAAIEHLEKRVTLRSGAPKSLYEVIAVRLPP